MMNQLLPAGTRSLFRRKIVRRTVWILVALTLSFMAISLIAELSVHLASKGRLVSSPEDLPGGKHDVGLVLGCSPYLANKMANPYFTKRIKAGAELWKSGKISSIIVSGDNRTHDYNEPQAMKNGLIELGVPDNRIVCDYAGLRTLDSVVRAKEIFGASRLVIITQEYHNKRALAIARHYDIDAYALNADNVNTRVSFVKNFIRERGARIKMLLDLWVFDTRPKHLGSKQNLPNGL